MCMLIGYRGGGHTHYLINGLNLKLGYCMVFTGKRNKSERFMDTGLGWTHHHVIWKTSVLELGVGSGAVSKS